MVEFTIQPAKQLTLEELYGILELRSAVFVAELERALKDVDGLDLDENVYQLFGTENGKVVTHLRLHKTGDEFHIRRVVVAKDYRRGGIARKMMEYTIDWCRKQGAKNVTLAAREYVSKFYESLEFVKLSDRYFHEQTGVWHFDMELVLDDK